MRGEKSPPLFFVATAGTWALEQQEAKAWQLGAGAESGTSAAPGGWALEAKAARKGLAEEFAGEC